MKKLTFITVMTGLLLSGCAKTDNPFLTENKNEYGLPAFDKIENRHYLPAFNEGIKQHRAEIEAIANNTDAPAFANTVEALDYSGTLLNTVTAVFMNLHEANTNDEMDKIAEEVTPLLTAHEDELFHNEKLFARIQTLYNERETLGLTTEQNRLLEKYHREFVRNGAALSASDKHRLSEINSELALAELQFGKNVLAETNAYKKVVSDEKELAGLPENVRQTAAEAAKEAGFDGKWLFTLHKASFIPALQYSENRELRKELLLAYTTRANHDNKNDNKALINKIIKLRVQKVNLLGYTTPAQFILEDKMAKTPAAVYELLNLVWQPSLAKAKQEAYDLQKLMDAEGKGEKL
ncbi:MAG: M3 family metallopeptidase, partial [Paludibacter sp.]|nr:M3 family metallopeptidase [Paludibacter sp.]